MSVGLYRKIELLMLCIALWVPGFQTVEVDGGFFGSDVGAALEVHDERERRTEQHMV